MSRVDGRRAEPAWARPALDEAPGVATAATASRPPAAAGTVVQPGGTRLAHQPGLDGLRGLAVAAVVLYHAAAAAGVGWMERITRGGYLGVSAFFTLSGFLICSLLLRERRRTGTVSLSDFWQRRARRLLPAALLLIGAVVVLTPVVGTSQQLATLPGDALASVLYVANWRFVAEGADYAAMFTGAPSPLRHLWSLAVEEQWYVVVPLLGVLLAAWARRVRAPRRGALLTVMALAVVALTAWMVVVSGGTWDNRAYMGTDTRLAEMAVGALAAVVVGRRLTLPPAARRVVGRLAPVALAVLLVAWALVPVRSGLLYRGGLTVHAALVAVVVLAAVQPDGVLRRLLSSIPLVRLGEVSYGVYLFHWPVVWWLTPERLGLGPTASVAAQVAVSLGIAAVSYRWLEQPIRRRRALRSWRGPTALVLAVAVVVTAILRLPEPDRSELLALGNAERIAVPTTVAGATRGEPAPGATPDGGDPPAEPVAPAPPLRVMVAGDSFAESILVGLQRWGVSGGEAAVMDATVPACPFGRGGRNRGVGIPRGEDPECRGRDAMWADSLAEFDPDVVLLAGGLWDVTDRRPEGFGRWTRIGRPDYDEFLRGELHHVIDVLQARGAAVLWANSPAWEPVPGSVIFMGSPPYAEAETRRVDLYNEMLASVAAERDGVELIDVAGWMRAQPGGELDLALRPDGVHFSDASTDRLAEWLGPRLLGSAGR